MTPALMSVGPSFQHLLMASSECVIVIVIVKNISNIKSSKKTILIPKIKNEKGEIIIPRRGIGEFFLKLYDDDQYDETELETDRK